MKFGKNIKRILLATTWTVLGAGVLVLLAAAINSKNSKTCVGVEIELNGNGSFLFLEKKDILEIVSTRGTDKPEGKVIAGFDLLRLEAVLKNNVWVKDAELYFSNDQVLHVNVSERVPVARIFSTGGHTFYIDSSGYMMPLSEKMTARLPVFTSFPDKQRLNHADSLLIQHIRNVSLYILNNPFWMAQIEQVDITPFKTFLMIPTVGNHIIQFGDGENYESKFRRLYTFYSQVLSRTGFDKYTRVNVEYDGQVIGTKKGMVAKIDSLQALKNIQKMIQDAMKATEDSIVLPEQKSNTEQVRNGIALADSVTRGRDDRQTVPGQKRVEKSVAVKASPKAVMHKLK